MKRNWALSILLVSLAVAAGTAQTNPKAVSEMVYLDGLTSVAEADFLNGYIAGINACSTLCGTKQLWNFPGAPANPPASQATSAPPAANAPQATPPAKVASAKPDQTANAAQSGEHAAASPSNDLSAVLATMNQSAAGFKSAQGDFLFETYQKVVDEKDQQQGRIYFRRGDKGVDAAFNVTGAAPKQVVYKDGKILIYEPKINQVTERDVSKNKSDVEAFLSLGFGARGNDLLRDYDVKMAGWETVDGVKTAKLELVSKSEKMRQTYNKILLWVDPERDVLLRQQFFEPSGDYRLAHYTNMKLNTKLSDDVFRLKTNGSTRTIKPQ
jgi:outer membrane lipoprotein-sorting protein